MKTPRAIFLEALEINDARQRDEFLSEACGIDDSLRREVDALLKAHAAAGPFMPAQAGPSPVRDALLNAVDALNPDRPIDLPANEKPAERIGRHKILQQIGEGGWGIVYLAEQQEPVYRKVALKIIKLGMDTKTVVARFEAERQALALMDHPNIAKVLDAGATETGRPYFVMEFVRGTKITDYCDRKSLSIQARLELFVQVCQAIQHAHQKGIIHRDIKPSNILVTERDGQSLPKVIDFGIAKATGGLRLTDKTLFTAFEHFIGTPDYMSPEQAAFGELDIDTRSDIYSLGVLLYELLTSKTPFDTKALLASGLDEMRRTIQEMVPARPSTRLTSMGNAGLTDTAMRRGIEAPRLIREIRGDLDWIVMKCLEKERNRRYETANGLALDVKRHLNTEPVVARPPSRLYEFRRAVRRHKVGFGAAATVGLAIALGVSALWYGLEQAKSERDQQKAVSYASDLALAWQAWRFSDYATCRRLLAANIPQSGERDLRSFEWWYLSRLSKREEAYSLGPIPGQIYGLGFLPGGRLIAGASQIRSARPTDASSEGSGLFVWDWKSHKLLTPVPVKTDGGVSALSISPDGGRIAVAIWWTKVQIFETTNFNCVTNLQFTNRIFQVEFSPNGRYLAARSEDYLYVHQLDPNGDTQILPAGVSAEERPAFSADDQLIAFTRPDRKLTVWNLTERRHAIELPNAADSHLTGNLGLDRIDWALNRHAFLANTHLLASGDLYGRVILHDLEDGSVRLMGAHFSGVTCMAATSDGQLLASADFDGLVKLWNPAEKKELAQFPGHDSTVSAMIFSPGEEYLVTGGKDGRILVWDTHPSPLPEGVVDQQYDVVKLLTVGRFLNLTSRWYSPNFRFLNYPNDPRPPVPSREDTVIKFHAETNRAVSLNGRYLADAGTNGHGQIRDLELDREVSRFQLEHGEIIKSVSSDGTRVASALNDGRVAVHEPAQAATRTMPEEKPSHVLALEFPPSGDYLVKAGADGWLRVWEMQNPRILTPIHLPGNNHLTAAGVMTFDQAGRFLAYADETESRVLLLDLIEAKLSREFWMPYFGWATRGLAFSPDTRWLAVSSGDYQVALYDWRTRQAPIFIGERRAHGFESMSFTPDGKRLALCSDGEVSFWDLQSKRELLSMWFDGTLVLDQLRFSPNGERLIVTIGDTCQIFSAPIKTTSQAAGLTALKQN
jgi:serine/threonine protein kinase/WD40 repeat protein